MSFSFNQFSIKPASQQARASVLMGLRFRKLNCARQEPAAVSLFDERRVRSHSVIMHVSLTTQSQTEMSNFCLLERAEPEQMAVCSSRWSKAGFQQPVA